MSKSQIHFTRRNATEKMEFIRKQMKIKEKDFDTFSVDVLDLEEKSAIELIHNYIEAIPEERRYLPNQTILISKKLYNIYIYIYRINLILVQIKKNI